MPVDCSVVNLWRRSSRLGVYFSDFLALTAAMLEGFDLNLIFTFSIFSLSL